MGRVIGCPTVLIIIMSYHSLRSASFRNTRLTARQFTLSAQLQRRHLNISHSSSGPNFSSPSLETSSTTLLMKTDSFSSQSNLTIKDRYCRSRLLFLKEELVRVSGIIDFNPNSPAQRSLAIFGEVRSCTQEILKRIVSPASNLPHDKRLIAEYVIEYLGLLKLQQQQQQQQQNMNVNEEKEITISEREILNKKAHPQNNHNRDIKYQPSTSNSEPIDSTNNVSMGGLQRQKRQPRQRPITYEKIVEGLFSSNKSLIDQYWEEPLLELSRPVARDLTKLLNPKDCPMGYDPDNRNGINVNNSSKTGNKKRIGTFLEFCRDQKKLHPHHVILVRCGDFYETFGVDSIILVEHVGLNPMGGKARSGCPKQNIQATLDGLTQQGFSVVVYEEIGTGSTTGQIKERALTQIVSPASPTYLYNNYWLLGGGSGRGSVSGGGNVNELSYSLDGLPPPRPCVGVVHNAAGYNIIEMSLEERSIQYSERLTSEAVACRLAAYPPADPLLYIPSHSEQECITGTSPTPSFLSKLYGKGKGNHRLRTKYLNPNLVPSSSNSRSDSDCYIQVVVDTFLKLNELQIDGNKQTGVSDFSVTMASTSTNPLYVETAMQIGLMDEKTIPSLVQHVLDDAAPAIIRRFLRRYLLIPPPPRVAQSMACIVNTLIDENSISLPPLTVPNLGKALILIRAGQAGANVYGELLHSLDTTLYVLNLYENYPDENERDETTKLFVNALLTICQHESGLIATRDSLLERCREAVMAIEAVVSTSYHVDDGHKNDDKSLDIISYDECIPVEFFERNERTWRGRVQHSVAKGAYRKVQDASRRLCVAVREDFIGNNDSNKSLLKYNYFDNLVALKKVPSEGVENEIPFIHPKDRFGKSLSNRWTTSKVQDAVSRYVTECENAEAEVSSILSRLAKKLQDDGHIPAIVQSSHLNLILSTAFYHAVKANKSNWELANIIEDGPSQGAARINNEKNQNVVDGQTSSSAETYFKDVFPYWMHRSKAVSNTFDLNSMILLTAPNMSGKSTLMRSTAAASLLSVCGLCAPLSSESRISRFDTLFLRGASADVPTEDKSAFGKEMDDLAALFRSSTQKSFVFVDELGRGTSPRDGTTLAGAVLENMADLGMSGIFATHLHDVFDLPLLKDRIIEKRIRIEHDGKIGSYKWTHKLEDGRCKDSMALITAKRFGLPDKIILRAKELTQFMPEKKNFTIVTNDADKNGYDSTLVVNSDDENVITTENIDVDFVSSVSDKANQFRRQQKAKEDRRTEFKTIIELASNFMMSAETSPVQIPPRHHPPASLSNRSCLYVIQLVPSSLSTSSSRYYVGETDSISQRLNQHRRKGNKWANSSAVAFPVNDKTQARYWESALIRELVRKNYSLESISDGRTLRHFRD